jgi:hypothetical protein
MDFFGDLRTISLKPGGDDIPVTEENRHECVLRSLAGWLAGSCRVGFRTLF